MTNNTTEHPLDAFRARAGNRIVRLCLDGGRLYDLDDGHDMERLRADRGGYFPDAIVKNLKQAAQNGPIRHPINFTSLVNGQLVFRWSGEIAVCIREDGHVGPVSLADLGLYPRLDAIGALHGIMTMATDKLRELLELREFFEQRFRIRGLAPDGSSGALLVLLLAQALLPRKLTGGRRRVVQLVGRGAHPLSMQFAALLTGRSVTPYGGHTKMSDKDARVLITGTPVVVLDFAGAPKDWVAELVIPAARGGGFGGKKLYTDDKLHVQDQDAIIILAAAHAGLEGHEEVTTLAVELREGFDPAGDNMLDVREIREVAFTCFVYIYSKLAAAHGLEKTWGMRELSAVAGGDGCWGGGALRKASHGVVLHRLSQRPWGLALVEFIRAEQDWTGSAVELRRALSAERPRLLDTSIVGLGKWLGGAGAGLLAQVGIDVEQLPRKNNCRPWRIWLRDSE